MMFLSSLLLNPTQAVFQSEPALLTNKQFSVKAARSQRLANSKLAYPKYRIVEMLNEGSFGEVFLCRHNARKLTVAKVSDANRQPHVFYNEVAMLRMFAHRNIVQVHEAFEFDSNLWLILEYMDGGDLRALCELPGLWTEPLLAYVVRQVLIALEFLHHRHVLHRDIKPDNILWDGKGNVKLGDFGFATMLTTEHFKHRGNMGTQGYRAPELVANKEYDCQVDIWSLGVSAVELLEGERQMWWDSGKACHSLPKRLFNDHLASKALEEFVRAMLKRDPSHRATARQLLEHRFMANKSLVKKKHFAEFALREKHVW
ncbi:hypothetical protein BASA81_002690 [Batrachochytrium salamandrivorans]|nr:hypothetical protein BASA81_002690 [Batrachochytrium salamandrivorans]